MVIVDLSASNFGPIINAPVYGFSSFPISGPDEIDMGPERGPGVGSYQASQTKDIIKFLNPSV